MIVRILGEDQRSLPDSALGALNLLDAKLIEACEAGEHDAFAAAFTALLTRVRDLGIAVAPDVAGPSELVLPSADASLAEVNELMTEDGLIPG